MKGIGTVAVPLTSKSSVILTCERAPSPADWTPGVPPWPGRSGSGQRGWPPAAGEHFPASQAGTGRSSHPWTLTCEPFCQLFFIRFLLLFLLRATSVATVTNRGCDAGREHRPGPLTRAAGRNPQRAPVHQSLRVQWGSPHGGVPRPRRPESVSASALRPSCAGSDEPGGRWRHHYRLFGGASNDG